MSEYIDNVSKRKEQLKQALKKLHEGTSLEELRAEFTEVLQNASAGEIAQIEQSRKGCRWRRSRTCVIFMYPFSVKD
jgi:hypothetical protein